MQIDRACFAIRSSAMRLSLKYFTCGYGIGWKLLAIRFVENFGTGEERGWKFPKFIASSINAFRCLRLWCVVRSLVESDLKKKLYLITLEFSAKNWKRSYYSTVKYLHSIWMVWMQFLLNQTLSILLVENPPTH